MQKTEYPANHHYAQHAVDLTDSGWHYGCTDCYDAQYGHTSHRCKLELHVGDHLYRKRGGANGAFHTDTFDYRYESLALSLGVSIEPDKMIGALLGNCYDFNNEGFIQFRISEEAPTDVVYYWKYDEDTYERIAQHNPLAIAIPQNRKWFVAAFSPARKNTDGPSDEFNDAFYDDEPDVADLYGMHWYGEWSDTDIANHRLNLFFGI